MRYAFLTPWFSYDSQVIKRIFSSRRGKPGLTHQVREPHCSRNDKTINCGFQNSFTWLEVEQSEDQMLRCTFGCRLRYLEAEGATSCSQPAPQDFFNRQMAGDMWVFGIFAIIQGSFHYNMSTTATDIKMCFRNLFVLLNRTCVQNFTA